MAWGVFYKLSVVYLNNQLDVALNSQFIAYNEFYIQLYSPEGIADKKAVLSYSNNIHIMINFGSQDK